MSKCSAAGCGSLACSGLHIITGCGIVLVSSSGLELVDFWWAHSIHFVLESQNLTQVWTLHLVSLYLL